MNLFISNVLQEKRTARHYCYLAVSVLLLPHALLVGLVVAAQVLHLQTEGGSRLNEKMTRLHKIKWC